MIVSKRRFWKELAAIPTDPATKRGVPFRLCPLLTFLNSDATRLAGIRDKVSRLLRSRPATLSPKWNEWINSPDLEDPLVLLTLAATGKGLNLGREDKVRLQKQLTIKKLQALQRDLRDDVALLVDETLPDDESAKRRVNDLVRRLNDTGETIRWSIYEKPPLSMNIASDKVIDVPLVYLAAGYKDEVIKAEMARYYRGVEAREALSVKRHPDIFGKQADLPFTTRYTIAEKAEPKRKTSLRNIFYLILSDLARNKLQRPRRCKETECAQFFIPDDPREKFCSVECRDVFHRRTLSSRVARSRAKKRKSAA